MTESKKNFTFNKSQSLLSETQTEMEQLWVTGWLNRNQKYHLHFTELMSRLWSLTTREAERGLCDAQIQYN